MTRILLTGGNGRLGTELRILLPDLIAPRSTEMDVTNAAQVLSVIERVKPDIIVHAAAYTNVGGAEKERDLCWKVNVEGTRNVAHAATRVSAKLLHISTDYVFDGEKGQYRETDIPGPVVNFYSLSKLVAEEAARSTRDYLIVRTSFRPREFQYPVAFSDVYTSQDYVDIIAPLISQVINHSLDIKDDILHVATERKSVYELAYRRNPNVQEGYRASASITLPGDVSLDTTRLKELQLSWQE